MTKYKVGDRVTFSGVVQSVDEEGIYSDKYRVYIDGDDGSRRFSEELLTRVDTTFRDQAAIAALQGMLSCPSDFAEIKTAEEYAAYALIVAEAIDAERKKRDGGE